MRQELLGSHFICVLYSITNTFQKYSITKGHYSNSSNLHFLKTVIYILTSTHSPCVSIFPSTAKTSLQPSCVSISILKTNPSIFAQVCKNQPSFAEHRTSPYLQVEGRRDHSHAKKSKKDEDGETPDDTNCKKDWWFTRSYRHDF